MFSFAFFCGFLLSVINWFFYYAFCKKQRKKIAKYPAQALVQLISMTITRFLLVGGLIIFALDCFQGVADFFILGFVFGQCFFLIRHLKVVKNNGN